MEKFYTPAEKELQQKKFEVDGKLFQEFNGDFEAYWNWFIHQDDVRNVRTMDGR